MRRPGPRDRVVSDDEEDAPPLPTRNRPTSTPSTPREQSVPTMAPSPMEQVVSEVRSSRTPSLSQKKGLPPPVVPRSRRNTIRSEVNVSPTKEQPLETSKLSEKTTIFENDNKRVPQPQTPLINELANLHLRNSEDRVNSGSPKKAGPPVIPKKKDTLKGKPPIVPKKNINLSANPKPVLPTPSQSVTQSTAATDNDNDDDDDNEDEHLSPLERYKRNIANNS